MFSIFQELSFKRRNLFFRVLFKSGDYEGSLATLRKIRQPDFQGLVSLALAANKAGHFEEAYNFYKASIPMASNDGDRSHVLAAMATIAYKFQVNMTFLDASHKMRPFE